MLLDEQDQSRQSGCEGKGQGSATECSRAASGVGDRANTDEDWRPGGRREPTTIGKGMEGIVSKHITCGREMKEGY